MRLFISHIHEERGIAEAIRDQLRSCFAALVDVFLAQDIPFGKKWLKAVGDELAKCDMVLVLFSKHSVRRPWVNIEAGSGVMADKTVIPICHSGFTAGDLPSIYSGLNSMDLLSGQDVRGLLLQIAEGTPAKFIEDVDGPVERWLKVVSNAVRSKRYLPELEAPPCVWVVGSNHGLSEDQTRRNKRFLGLLATAFMQRGIRVVFGRSDLLDDLGNALNAVSDSGPLFGIERDRLSEFANEAALQKDSATAPPNPIVLLGSLRSKRAIGEIFYEAIGHAPDAVLVLGGSPTGRTSEEVQHAVDAGIAALPLHFTGGAAEKIPASTDATLAEIVAKVQGARSDFSAVAQQVCDVLEQQAKIQRSRQRHVPSA